ncbi:hypothetical protein I4F81_010687 [Pyropia yezoensis]|uniref:Uncharacterized protein n=1 Tax=Pyropia yezoensis TaxID=2788 RepID=A0ACC3CDP5_PYRYE|nr:hypothetical protein I4F81_010687 [Neopyropia yezoensis]
MDHGALAVSPCARYPPPTPLHPPKMYSLLPIVVHHEPPHLYACGLVLTVTSPNTLSWHASRQLSGCPSSLRSSRPLRPLHTAPPSMTSTLHVPQLAPPPQLVSFPRSVYTSIPAARRAERRSSSVETASSVVFQPLPAFSCTVTVTVRGGDSGRGGPP